MDLSEDNLTILACALVTTVVAVAAYFVIGSSSTTPAGNSTNTTSSSQGGKRAADNKMPENRFPAGPLRIFFGSQTGTAEGFARTLMEETRKVGFDAKTADLEDFDPEQLCNETPLAVFLMATYGEGEPTDNATRFLQWAKNADGEVADDALKKTSFMVFGLGNKQYDQYNKMGKDVDKYLDKLGGRRVMDLGLGDDNGTLEEDFEAWRNLAVSTMMVKFHPNAAELGYTADKLGAGEEDHGFKPPDRVSLQYTATVLPASARNDPAQCTPNLTPALVNTSTRHFFTAPEAKVLVNRELRTHSPKSVADAVGSTKHLEISLEGTGLAYDTADNFAILPENDSATVAAVAAVLKYDLDDVFTVGPVAGSSDPVKAVFPTPCTVRDAFTRFLDIKGAPRMSLLQQLHPYVQDAKQQQWLAEMLGKENRDTFRASLKNSCASFASIVTTQLTSISVPLSDLLHILPPVQPRFYTISSSSSVFPDTVHLTIATTEQDISGELATVGGASNGKKAAKGAKKVQKFKGLCSGYCETLVPGRDTMRVFIRTSSFRLPADIRVPITMIGPGTGIAPMRALLQERYYQSVHGPTAVSGINAGADGEADGVAASGTRGLRTRSTSGGNFKTTSKPAKPAAAPFALTEVLPRNHDVGENVLFFGCRKASTDYIYKEELQHFRDTKTLDELQVAFSREGPKKVYVQDLLREEKAAAALVRQLDAGGYIYVCGATAMGADVMDAIAHVLATHKPKEFKDKDAAMAHIHQLQTQGRYVAELWSA